MVKQDILFVLVIACGIVQQGTSKPIRKEIADLKIKLNDVEATAMTESRKLRNALIRLSDTMIDLNLTLFQSLENVAMVAPVSEKTRLDQEQDIDTVIKSQEEKINVVFNTLKLQKPWIMNQVETIETRVKGMELLSSNFENDVELAKEETDAMREMLNELNNNITALQITFANHQESENKADLQHSDTWQQADIEEIREARKDIKTIRQAKADIASLRQAQVVIDDVRQAKNDVAAIRQAKADIDDIRQAKIDLDDIRQAKAILDTIRQAKDDIADIRQAKADIADIRQAKADIADITQAKADIADIRQAKADIAAIRKARADIEAMKQAQADIEAYVGTTKQDFRENENSCPKQWVQFGSFCYRDLGNSYASTTAIKTLCDFAGVRSYIVDIQSPAEQTFIGNLVNHTPYFLGLLGHPHGTFKWIRTNKSPVYSNWAASEPSTRRAGAMAWVDQIGGSQWKTFYGGGVARVICKKEMKQTVGSNLNGKPDDDVSIVRPVTTNHGVTTVTSTAPDYYGYLDFNPHYNY